MDKLIDEWPIFQNRATRAVQKGYEPEHWSGYSDQLLLQVLVKPSFASVVGWQLYQRDPVIYRRHPIENNGLPRYVACRTEWVKDQDVHKFASPITNLQYLNRLSPTMDFQMVETGPDWAQEIVKKLLAVSVPTFIKSNSIGLDGVSYELNWGNYMAGVKFQWWGDGPDEWRPITDIAIALVGQMETLRNHDNG